jgi:hypothetical protein
MAVTTVVEIVVGWLLVAVAVGILVGTMFDRNGK